MLSSKIKEKQLKENIGKCDISLWATKKLEHQLFIIL